MPRIYKYLTAQDGVLFTVVRTMLNALCSPQQIGRKLRLLWPNNSELSVSHETIYNAIYLHPRGELKRELIACLRHYNQARKPRSRGTDRRYIYCFCQHQGTSKKRSEWPQSWLRSAAVRRYDEYRRP